MTLRKHHSIIFLSGLAVSLFFAGHGIAADSEKPAFKSDKMYDLAGVLDIALANNPYTRQAWQRAEAAAAKVGEAKAPYYPQVAFRFVGGVEQSFSPVASGPNYYERGLVAPAFLLEYLLVDFGRRKADVTRTLNMLDAANLTYDRQLQKTVFAVQRAYFRHSAAIWEEKSAVANRELARTLLESVEAKMKSGLATEPEMLLTRQTLADADYDLATSQRSAKISLGELRTAAGVPANAPLNIEPLAPLDSFTAFQQKLDKLIDTALADRPDLAGRVADLRAREAATDWAKADFLPKISLEGGYRNETFRYHAQDGKDEGTYGGNQNQYGAFLVVDWQLFDGFERVQKLRQSRADEEVARADIEIKRLDTILDVWTSYYDVLTSLRRMEAAKALLNSSQETFDAQKASFDEGLVTITDLVSARSSLTAAQFLRAEASADYLTAVASLSLAMGTPTKSKPMPLPQSVRD